MFFRIIWQRKKQWKIKRFQQTKHNSRPCALYTVSCAHIHTNIRLLHFSPKDFLDFLILKAPKCTCQMERIKKTELLTSHYVVGAPWFKYLCSIFHFILICLWFVFIQLGKICIKPGDGLLDRLTNTHIYSTSTSKYCNMSSKPERAYPSPRERRSFQSIKYQLTHRPKFFPLCHLFAGNIHIAQFQLY